MFVYTHGQRTPSEAFFIEIQNFWADTLWGIWGIFGQIISTHFGTVSPCFPLFNHHFYKE